MRRLGCLGDTARPRLGVDRPLQGLEVLRAKPSKRPEAPCILGPSEVSWEAPERPLHTPGQGSPFFGGSLALVLKFARRGGPGPPRPLTTGFRVMTL